jgi:hypothetical protein
VTCDLLSSKNSTAFKLGMYFKCTVSVVSKVYNSEVIYCGL